MNQLYVTETRLYETEMFCFYSRCDTLLSELFNLISLFYDEVEYLSNSFQRNLPLFTDNYTTS